MKALEVYREIGESKIIAIVRKDSEQEIIQTCTLLQKAGIKVIEIPLMNLEALKALEKLSKSLKGVLLGAGTILDEASAKQAIMSGARFLVTPTVKEETIKMGNRYGVPVIAGIYTPTEMQTALECGCLAVKLFPASESSPNALKAYKAPIPNAEIVPMGGITLENADEWLKAGAYALGVGSPLSSGSEDEITENAKKFIELVKKYQGR